MDNYFDDYGISFLSGAVAGNLIEDECLVINHIDEQHSEQNEPTRISIKSNRYKIPPFEQYVYNLLNR